MVKNTQHNVGERKSTGVRGIKNNAISRGWRELTDVARGFS